NSPYRGMLDREFDDPAYFMLVDTTLDRRNDRDVQPNLREPVEGAQFLVEDIGLPADDSIGLWFEAIKLEIERGSHLIELLKKVIISGDSLGVRVEHDEPDVAGPGGAHKIDDLRMDGGLAAGELNHLRLSLRPHVIVEHLLDFFEGEAEPRRGVSETQRTIHVAGTVDLDDPEARMLLVFGPQPAIARATN